MSLVKNSKINSEGTCGSIWPEVVPLSSYWLRPYYCVKKFVIMWKFKSDLFSIVLSRRVLKKLKKFEEFFPKNVKCEIIEVVNCFCVCCAPPRKQVASWLGFHPVQWAPYWRPLKFRPVICIKMNVVYWLLYVLKRAI